MTSNIINEITLNCLVNKFKLEKLIIKRHNNDVVQNDAQIFKKELIQLFNDLLDDNSPEDILPCVKNSFNYYIEQCVCYLKIQNSYHEVDDSSSVQTNKNDNNECDDEDCGDDFNYDDNY